MGAGDSGNPEQSFGKGMSRGKREGAPVKGVKDSDTSAQFSGLTNGGVEQDTLDIGEDKRE